MLDSNTKKNLARLLDLCESGSLDEVKEHIKKAGFDLHFLNSMHPKTFLKVASAICAPAFLPFFEPLACRKFLNHWPNPLSRACDGDNVEVVKLLLKLGVDPRPEDHGAVFPLDPPRMHAIGKPELRKLLSRGRPWWTMAPTRDEKEAMLEWEKDFVLPPARLLVWCLMRGCHLSSPWFFHKPVFLALPQAMKEFIVHFGVAPQDQAKFLKWVTKRKLPAAVKSCFLGKACRCLDGWQENLKTLSLSQNLLPDDKFFAMMDSVFSTRQQIAILQRCMDTYDGSANKPLLEESIDFLLGTLIRRTDAAMKKEKWGLSRPGDTTMVSETDY